AVERHQSASGGGRGVSTGAGADGPAGGARSGDDGGLGRREGRTSGGTTGLPVGLLRPDIDHAGWQAGTAGSAGSNRAFLDRAVRTLSAIGAGAGVRAGGDVRARGFDPQSEDDYRGAVRPQLFGFVDQCNEPGAGCEFSAICRSPLGRSLPLSDPRRALRAGARGRCDRQPGGADRDRDRLGRPPPGTGGRARQPREPVELAGFLLGVKTRGLHGVEFVVADDHAGLRAALREVLAEAAYQRCYVHFLRNALDHVPRKVDDDCLQELRWLYDRRDLTEARRDLAAWLAKCSGKYSKLTGWVEDNIDETLTPAFARAGSFTGCRGSTINISNR